MMAQVLSLLSSFLSIIIFVNSESDVCIWGRKQASTTFVNGLYTFNSNGRNAAYYEKIDTECPANTLYLYKDQGQWRIGPALEDPSTVVMRCNSDVFVENPQDCGSNWEFDGVLDSAVRVFEDECPNLGVCDRIFAVYTDLTEADDCIGPFNRYNDETNAFFARRITGEGTFLFFSETDFRWICSASSQDIIQGGKCLNVTASESVINYQLEPGWSNFKRINSINKYSWSFTKNNTIYIECDSQSPTLSPTPSPVVNYTLSVSELDTFRTEIKKEFDNSGETKPLLAASVRLAFSDCIGPKEYNTLSEDAPISICDGCIDLQNDFHSGLYELAISPLEDIYYSLNNEWSEKMSLADFWAAVGTVAIEYGIELSGSDMVEIPFLFGRRDCTESPDINVNDTITKDLDSLITASFGNLTDFFENDLNFTVQDMIAMMGMHTLGMADEDYYGFEGSWTDDPYIFDNAYFSNLLNDQYFQSRTYAYWYTANEENIMLNTDIVLAYDVEEECIVNKATDIVSDDPTCSIRTETEDIIQAYADNNELFIDDFISVWMKLVSMGYSNDQIVVVDSSLTTAIPETTDESIAYQPQIVYHGMVLVLIMTVVFLC